MAVDLFVDPRGFVRLTISETWPSLDELKKLSVSLDGPGSFQHVLADLRQVTGPLPRYQEIRLVTRRVADSKAAAARCPWRAPRQALLGGTRNPSCRPSQSAIWFQLANIRLTRNARVGSGDSWFRPQGPHISRCNSARFRRGRHLFHVNSVEQSAIVTIPGVFRAYSLAAGPVIAVQPGWPLDGDAGEQFLEARLG